MLVKQLASGVYLSQYMSWVLFYSKNLPRNQEEYGCGTFWHSHIWHSLCLFSTGVGRKAKEGKEKWWEDKRVRGWNIPPKGMFTTSQPAMHLHNQLESWAVNQRLSLLFITPKRKVSLVKTDIQASRTTQTCCKLWTLWQVCTTVSCGHLSREC